jgi:hypothetical protein
MSMSNKARLLVVIIVLFGIASASAQAADKPKIMILIQEKVMGVFGTTGWEVPTQAELTLMEKFNRLGYVVVDPQVVRKNLLQAKGLRLLAADDKGAAATGLQHGAELAIVGTAISKPAGDKLFGTQMLSIQATVTARVVQTDIARVIATGTATSSKVHIDQVQGGVLAIQEATQQLADDLIAKMQTAYVSSGGAGSPGRVALNISGLVSYRHLDFILNFFETKVNGVQGVHLDSFNSGIADVALTYQGATDDLARKLAKERFKGFRLEPTYVTANRMDLTVVTNRKRGR